MGVDSRGLDIADMLTLEERERLGMFVKHIDKRDMKALEIGSWKGCSAKAIAEQLIETGGTLICVDDWKGNGNADTLQIATKEDVFHIFRNNMQILGLWDILKPMIMTSKEASLIVEDETLDFIFLDADHSYEEVKADILRWMPKLKYDGAFCGHDLDHEGVRLATEELLSDKCIKLDGTRLWFYRKEVGDAKVLR